MNHETLAKYYAVHANDYEGVYLKPERQADLAALKTRLAEVLRGHKVLEIACGTGYWTEAFASSAASVHATDLNPGMLALAQARGLSGVSFAQADAFDLPSAPGAYTAVFAGFWWSHVKKEEQDAFLAQLRAKLGKDVLLVLMDNCYVDGSSLPIARTDMEGNTYQFRDTAGGERFEIVKNFLSDSQLRKKMADRVREIRIERSRYYWLLSCRLK